jgi:hypothetical protein
MAYSEHKHSTGTITRFWPDDTSTEFYLDCSYTSYTMEDILERAVKIFGEVTLGALRIEAEHIHTDCLYYNSYDSGDYTNFLKITKIVLESTQTN